jgi:uncharacterized membrane protein
MGHFADYASQALGVRLPEDYANFMETYGKMLSEDPVHKGGWIGGLGSPDFVIGTTLAFRSMVPGFRIENVVIGYLGIKTIVVNKMYEDIDEYLLLDTRDGSLLAIDSPGVTNKIVANFEKWIAPDLLRVAFREKYASNLTVIVFDDELKAGEARVKLLDLQQEGFIELEGAVVMVKEQDGATRYHQTHRPARKRGLAGSITGIIVGSIFFSPLIGAVFGAFTGAVSGLLTDAGIDDQFMKDLLQKLKPGCSALFTLVRKADPERVGEAFSGFGGRLMVNSVSKERESAIQKLLDTVDEGVK